MVVADELQAEFIYEHVEDAEAASTGVGSIGIHDHVGIVGDPNEILHEESDELVRLVDHLVCLIYQV